MSGITVTARKSGGQIVGTLVRGDSNTTAVRIVIPRMAGGVDLAELEWSVGVKNAEGETMAVYPERMEVDGDTISFDWYPGGIATSAVGTTLFDAVGMDSGSKVWGSAPYILIIADNLGIERGRVDVTTSVLGKAVLGEMILGE